MQTVLQLWQLRSMRVRWMLAPGELIALACDLYRAGFRNLDECIGEARAWIARRSRREASQ